MRISANFRPRTCEKRLVCHRGLSPLALRLVARLACLGYLEAAGPPAWHAGLCPSQLGCGQQRQPPSFPTQLSLRLKAMKRQVEEAEEEIDRLESAKKKLQRELEEQMDVNEQLQGQLNSMKKNFRWASAATPQGCHPDTEGSPCFGVPSRLLLQAHFLLSPFGGHPVLQMGVAVSTSVSHALWRVSGVSSPYQGSGVGQAGVTLWCVRRN